MDKSQLFKEFLQRFEFRDVDGEIKPVLKTGMVSDLFNNFLEEVEFFKENGCTMDEANCALGHNC